MGEVLTILLLMLSALFVMLMDLSSENRFNDSIKILRWTLKKAWLNKDTGWKYKWKNGYKSHGERFLFSSTIFVGFTDFWHMMKMGFNMCWHIALAINTGYNALLSLIVIKIVYGFTFELTYRKLKKILNESRS